MAARHIVFWSLPAIVLVVVLRAQLVRVILGAGEFDWADTRLTAAALALFVISLTAQALVMLLVRGYYAAGNTRKPLVANVLSSGFAVLSAYVLLQLFQSYEGVRSCIEQLLRVSDIPGTEVLMLPLGYALGMLLNACALLVLFGRDHGSLFSVLRSVFWKTGFASLVGGAAAYYTLAAMSIVVDMDTFWGILAQGFVAGIVGILVIAGVLVLLKSREFTEAWESFHHKFWKETPVVPEGVHPEQEG